MSFNHLNYDTCTYSRKLKESVTILDYVLSPYRYEHDKKCRHNLGIVAGSAVSHIKGDLVDLDSDMRGQTRYLTKCIDSQYKPLKVGESIINDKTAPISTYTTHLPPCQMISYKEVPFPPSN
jgi:hypothetical protein